MTDRVIDKKDCTTTTQSYRFRKIIVLAFLVRVILIPFFSDGFNFWAFRSFTDFFVDGFNPWTIVHHDPTMYWINPWRYPPAFFILTVPIQVISSYVQNEIFFLYLIKTPLIAADLITIFFLHKTLILLSGDLKKASRLTMLYAFNPVVLLVSTVWGTLDPISIMFTTISVYFFLTAVSTTRLATSAIFLGWGIAFKLYPIFILPAFVSKLRSLREGVTYIFLACLPLAIFSCPFLIWDPVPYIDCLIFHSAGGMHPLYPALYPETSLLVQILFFFPIITLFVIAYSKKISIIAKMALSFFALYFAFGGFFTTNYFSWMIPTGIVVLADRSIKKFKGSWLLPFLAIPSIAHTLIFNGAYNAVEGATGIFYWAYHWLKLKIVVFRVLPFLQEVTPVIFWMNIALMAYFFYMILRRSHVFTIGRSRDNNALPVFHQIGKNKNTVFSCLAVLMVTMLIFPNIISFEPMKPAPDVSGSKLIFFDNFSGSTLNYQWVFAGDGTYSLYPNSNPSHIRFNARGNPHNTAYIYRGWGPLLQGFPNSTLADITLDFKFNHLATEAKGLTIAKADGWRFGVVTNWLSTYFVYHEEATNKSVIVAHADRAWHTFKISYNASGLLVYFDDGFVGDFESQKTFSFLFLGNSDAVEGFCGSCSISSVEVVIRDFTTGAHGRAYAALALGGSSIILAIITIAFLYPTAAGLGSGKFVRRGRHDV